ILLSFPSLSISFLYFFLCWFFILLIFWFSHIFSLPLSAMLLLVNRIQFIITGDKISPAERAIYMMNHRTRLDWMYFWAVLYQLDPNLLTTLKIVLKSSLKSLPGAGWAMQFKNFIFLERSWDQDKETLEKSALYYSKTKQPFQVLIFPEGTDYCTRSKIKSDSFASSNNLTAYKFVLQPRTTGVINFINYLRNQCAIDSIYDITVSYPDTVVQTEYDYFTGHSPRQVCYHIKKLDIAAVPTDLEAAALWLRQVWSEKEEALSRFYKDLDQNAARSYDGRMIAPSSPKLTPLYTASLFWLFFLLLWMYLLLVSVLFRIYIFLGALWFFFVEKYFGGWDMLQIHLLCGGSHKAAKQDQKFRQLQH
ncbi:unnamed protein product, partial [Soboliphyme baturini]|uniref:PlsC domain-containing protein n=1 Tax=Soboliphyme baturini TaxID=241478 RepID=A0A183J3Q6_9BILA